MRFVKRLFTKSLHVKPTVANRDAAQWLVVNHTPLTAFVDDLRRYGWRVAVYNLKEQLG